MKEFFNRIDLSNRFLGKYRHVDFYLKQRIRFLFFIGLASIGFASIVLGVTIFNHLNVFEFRKLYWPIYIPIIVLIFLLGGGLLLIIKGFFNSASHVITGSLFGVIWIVMWIGNNLDILSRLNTVVYLFVVFAMLPMLIQNKRWYFFYLFVNGIMLFVFTFQMVHILGVSKSSAIDFISDTILSMLFVSLVGYYIYSINNNTLQNVSRQKIERKVIAKKLVNSNERFLGITDLLPQAVYEADLHGNLVYFNNYAFEQFGYTQQDLQLGINISQLVVEIDKERVATNILRILSGETLTGNQYTAIRKNGTTFPIQTYSQAAYTDNLVTGIRGIIIDISERKSVERALEESRLKYKTLLENINEVIMMVDNDDRVQFVNHKFTEVLGYTADEIIGKIGYEVLLEPNERIVIIEANKKRLNKLTSQYEITFTAKDKRKIDFLMNGAPMLNANGEVIGSIGAMVDITERNLSEKALRQSELRYRTMFENAQFGIYQTTPAGEILIANPALVKMLGYQSFDQLKVRDLNKAEVFVDSSRGKFKKLMELNDEVVNFESQWLTADNDFIVVLENAKAVRNANGEIIHYDGFVENITQRVLAEKALKESQALFQTLANMSPVGIFRTDANGQTTYVNPYWSSLSGLSFNEALGNGWLKAVHPLDRENLAKGWEDVSVKGEQSTVEYRFLKSDGSVSWVLGNAIPETVDGKLIGYVGTITNITEIKQAQEEIVKSEKKFHELAEMLPQTVWEANTNGLVTFLNQYGIGTFGYTNEDLQNGVYLHSTIVPEQQQFARERMMHILNLLPANVDGTDFIAVRKDNSTFPVRIYATAIINDDQVVGLRGITLDMSEIKKAEQELRQSEERNRIIIEAIPDMIVIAQLNGDIVFCNKPFTVITSLNVDSDVNSVNIWQYVATDDLLMVKSTVDKLLASNKNYTDIIEFRFIDLYSNVHWFRGVISKITMNNLPQMQWIISDVTQKKIVEDELHQHREHLELLVTERTEELAATNEELLSTNEELFIQRRELEEALRNLGLAQTQLVHAEKMASLGVMAAGVAHEINNPLNFISGGVFGVENYIQEHLPEHVEELKPLLDSMQVGVKRAAKIVSSLNHYSRRNDLPRTLCDINAVIDSCLVMLNNQLGGRIEVIKDYIQTDYEFMANEGAIHQIFVNLIVNAIQAIENKGVITISTKIEKNSLLVTISDDGCGISQENLTKITDPFFTTKPPGKGTGLGLSITDNLIREYGGTLKFNSKEGIGTTVCVTFPVQ